MATGEHLDLAQRFMQGLHHEFQDQRLRNSRIPLSTIMDIIRDALDRSRFFSARLQSQRPWRRRCN